MTIHIAAKEPSGPATPDERFVAVTLVRPSRTQRRKRLRGGVADDPVIAADLVNGYTLARLRRASPVRLCFNRMVSDELRAAIVIARDHLDSGRVASPYRFHRDAFVGWISALVAPGVS